MTAQIQAKTSKRIKMSFDGSQMRIACDNGDVLILDARDGDCYKMRDNRLVSKPPFCPHKNTEPYIVDPVGGNVDICLDCGEMIDPDEAVEPKPFDQIDEIEF